MTSELGIPRFGLPADAALGAQVCSEEAGTEVGATEVGDAYPKLLTVFELDLAVLGVCSLGAQPGLYSSLLKAMGGMGGFPQTQGLETNLKIL